MLMPSFLCCFLAYKTLVGKTNCEQAVLTASWKREYKIIYKNLLKNKQFIRIIQEDNFYSENNFALGVRAKACRDYPNNSCIFFNKHPMTKFSVWAIHRSTKVIYRLFTTPQNYYIFDRKVILITWATLSIFVITWRHIWNICIP